MKFSTILGLAAVAAVAMASPVENGSKAKAWSDYRYCKFGPGWYCQTKERAELCNKTNVCKGRYVRN